MKSGIPYIAILCAAALTLCLPSCNKEPKEDPSGPTQGIKEGDPISVSKDGKVLFFIKSLEGATLKDSVIVVNSLPYAVQADAQGREYVQVIKSAFGEYSAEFVPEHSSDWNFGSTSTKDLLIPNGQFFGRTEKDLQSMPRFGAYAESTGNVLRLVSPYAVVKVNLTGEGLLASLFVGSDSPVSGLFDWSRADGKVTARSGGVKSAVLNCLEKGGAPMTGSFRIAVLPGTYKSLTVRAVSKDHKKCEKTLSDITLAAGDTYSMDMTFDPGNNVFYEGFDTFVWGGNPIAGAGSAAFAPDASVPVPATALSRTGFEYAKTAVPLCTTYGAAYFQEHNENMTPKDFDVMNKTYFASRNASDYVALARCIEQQGCLAMSPVSGHRGWLTLPAAALPRMCDAKFSFDFSFMAGVIDDLEFYMNGSGVITSATVDGKEILSHTAKSARKSPAGRVLLSRSDISVPSSATAAKKWHRVSITVRNITDFNEFKFMPVTTASGSHGCYFDNLQVDLLTDRQRGDVRLLFWNILYGMDSDRKNGHNNYDGFVEWIKGYDPDICVFCEAKSSGSANPLPNTYPDLAKRYGHSYVAGTGSYYEGSGDNFPQEVTSKFPLTHVKNVKYSAPILGEDGKTTTRVSHGGGLVKVDLGGRVINIVPLHLIPRTTAENNACDAYQEKEMEAILKATVLDPAYASDKDWIVLGDFNCQTPAEQWFYDAIGSTMRYKAHAWLRNNTDLVDVLVGRYPDCFCYSCGSSRIDFIYASPSVYKDIVAGGIVIDSWCHSVSIDKTPDYYPSDHKPIMIDFKK